MQAPIFGILDTFGRNSSFKNNIIQPWPYAIGKTKPLLSTNADGIHCGEQSTLAGLHSSQGHELCDFANAQLPRKTAAQRHNPGEIV